MNPTQIGGILRAILTVAAGYIAGKGLIPGEWVSDIVGVGAALGVAIWSYYTNKTASMISSIANESEVKKVVTTSKIADADPNPKVVSNGH